MSKKDRLSRPMRDVLGALTLDWKQAPLWAMSGTLLCLERRGLAEKRAAPGFENATAYCGTNSYAYQWRRTMARSGRGVQEMIALGRA